MKANSVKLRKMLAIAAAAGFLFLTHLAPVRPDGGYNPVPTLPPPPGSIITDDGTIYYPDGTVLYPDGFFIMPDGTTGWITR